MLAAVTCMMMSISLFLVTTMSFFSYRLKSNLKEADCFFFSVSKFVFSPQFSK